MYDQRSPRISATCERGDVSSPEWLVVWERHLSGGDVDVILRRVPRSGNLVHPKYPIANSAAPETAPVVAGPTAPNNGRRFHLVVYQRNAAGVNWNIQARLIDRGALVAEVDVSGLATGLSNRDFTRPSVAAGPARFLIAWQEEYPLTPGDWDVYAAVLHVEDASAATLQLGASDRRSHINSSTDVETGPSVAALFEANLRWPDHLIVNTWRPMAGGTPELQLSLHRGVSAVQTRQVLQHGCGFPIQSDGEAYLGTELTVTVPGGGGPFTTSGTLVGIPFPAPIPLCGTCLLGVDGDVYPAHIRFDMPLDGNLLGAYIAVQGYDLIGGSCFGSIRVSDTLVFTLR